MFICNCTYVWYVYYFLNVWLKIKVRSAICMALWFYYLNVEIYYWLIDVILLHTIFLVIAINLPKINKRLAGKCGWPDPQASSRSNVVWNKYRPSLPNSSQLYWKTWWRHSIGMRDTFLMPIERYIIWPLHVALALRRRPDPSGWELRRFPGYVPRPTHGLTDHRPWDQQVQNEIHVQRW